VPLSNFAGWVLSATVATVGFDATLRTDDVTDRLSSTPYLLDDLVSFTVLWGVVNAVYGNLLPFVVSLLLVTMLVRAERFSLPGLTG
jgi:putative membrane protein